MDQKVCVCVIVNISVSTLFGLFVSGKTEAARGQQQEDSMSRIWACGGH